MYTAHVSLAAGRPWLCMPNVNMAILFNSTQFSLFSTQHIVHTTMFFYSYDVLKMERAEDSAYVSSFPNII